MPKRKTVNQRERERGDIGNQREGRGVILETREKGERGDMGKPDRRGEERYGETKDKERGTIWETKEKERGTMGNQRKGERVDIGEYRYGYNSLVVLWRGAT
jgi:hypothetical protein